MSGEGSGSSDAAEQEGVDTAEWEAVDTSEWGASGKPDGWRMKDDHPDKEIRVEERKKLIKHPAVAAAAAAAFAFGSPRVCLAKGCVEHNLPAWQIQFAPHDQCSL
jgi:hypothetical protein